MSRTLWVTILLLAGCGAPELRGAAVDAEHVMIRTDADDMAFARRVADEAERMHRKLRRYFGGSPDRVLILTATSWSTYQSICEFSVSAGEYHHSWFTEPYVINSWNGDLGGLKGMAHELVHHFVHSLVPETPLWLNEGIAEALEHSSGPLAGGPEGALDAWSCPLRRAEQVGKLAPRNLDRRLDRLFTFKGSWDGPLVDGDLRLLAALVVRFGMETQGWGTLRDAVEWMPDRAHFVRWLRGSPKTHDHFPPLLDPS